jgi:[protein-PII] uridylyltransferase
MAGGTGFQVVEHRYQELLAEEVRGHLPATVGDDEIAAHFANLPARYFRIHTGEEVARDVALAHLFMRRQLEEADLALVPVVSWHDQPDRGHTAVKICTWDRPGLFTRIAGTLTAAGFNILGAQLFSRADGIILDTLLVTDAHTGLLANRETRATFEKLLGEVIAGGADLDRLLARREAPSPLYQSLEEERIPLNIRFENEVSDSDTVLDLEAEDRGLLYRVSQALAELGLDITLARISTEKGAAVDTFYVREEDGSKAVSTRRQAEIRSRLMEAVLALEPG